MASKTLLFPAISMVLGVGVLIGSYLLLRSDRPTGSADRAADPAALAQVGMQGASFDPARRRGDEPDAEVNPDEPARSSAAARQPRSADPGDRTRPDPPPPPGEPVVLTPDEEAAQAAYRALQATATSAVQAQLGDSKDALREACWTPANTGAASSASFDVSASFDAGGKLLSLGISDKRPADGGAVAVGVGNCLRSKPLALAIDPPGQNISVAASLTLP